MSKEENVIDLDFLSWKRSKIWEMCICTTKDGVKKLVAPMDELERASQLFFCYTLHEDGTTIQPNGINCQTILKIIEFSCDSRSGQWLRQEVEAMLQ